MTGHYTSRALQDSIESGFVEVVAKHTPGGLWDEDSISVDLVVKLALLCRNTSFVTPDLYFVALEVEPYRHKRPLEELYGDLAIIVSVKSANHSFQGVSFFEAKQSDGTRGYRWQRNQPEKYLSQTSQHFTLFYEKAASAPADCGLASSPELTSVFVAASGTVLTDRARKPEAFSPAFSSHLVNRTFLGFDADVRPSAVANAFILGAKYYLAVRVGIDYEQTIARTLCEQVDHIELVPERIASLWTLNDTLRAVARDNGIEPPEVRPLSRRPDVHGLKPERGLSR